MAIAYDVGAALAVTPGSTWTLASGTLSATNEKLVVHVTSITVGSTCSGVTCNGVAMAQVLDYTPVRQGKKMYIYVLAGATTGDIVATFNQSTNGRMFANSFTGCAQTNTADSTGTNSGTAATSTVSVTTSADNCWLVGMSKDDAGGATAGANTTSRANVSTGEGDRSWSTSTAQTPAGSKSMACSAGGQASWDFAAISIAPFVASATPRLRSLLGVGL